MAIARVTLHKARHFLDLAERLEPDQPEVYVALLEASIVFGRSITWHLKKEFAHHSGFTEWYSDQQSLLAADVLCVYFKHTRTFITHQGPVPVRRNISVAIEFTVELNDATSAVVPRGNPWYRRRPKVICNDLRCEIQQRVRRLWNRLKIRGRRLLDRAGKKPPQEPLRTASSQPSNVTQTFHFDDERWRDRPAPDLVRAYLDKLEPIVAEAERKYASR
jgi:hypothetical protein